VVQEQKAGRNHRKEGLIRKEVLWRKKQRYCRGLSTTPREGGKKCQVRRGGNIANKGLRKKTSGDWCLQKSRGKVKDEPIKDDIRKRTAKKRSRPGTLQYRGATEGIQKEAQNEGLSTANENLWGWVLLPAGRKTWHSKGGTLEKCPYWCLSIGTTLLRGFQETMQKEQKWRGGKETKGRSLFVISPISARMVRGHNMISWGKKFDN